MKYDQLTSEANLLLAWRRITTGGNYQYKKYFRDIYSKYEIALRQNLLDLQARLRGHSYAPLQPTRIYIPKPSGLHRPITLLSLEDQIILQAIANRFATKLEENRKKLELKYVFSNILSKGKSNIFFLEDWHHCYAAFQDKVTIYYNKGYHWFAKFDLAAFYDTISYDLLLSVLFPRGGDHEMKGILGNWFKCWSAENYLRCFSHGIPQGPVASDFLAECFLMPIDLNLARKKCPYIRYVDDIRIFGKTEREVREHVVYLERLCRERGLIPQSAKLAIQKAKTLAQILDILPSLTPTHLADREDKRRPSLSKGMALKMFRNSLSGKPQKIADKTKAKYVLFRAPKSAKILNYVIKLLPKHPEFIDAFCSYLRFYKRHEKVINVCRHTIAQSPYDYVVGELWHVLSRMSPVKDPHELISAAIDIAKDPKAAFPKKWGACHFLCAYEELTGKQYSKFLMFQDNALLQALLVPRLPKTRFAIGDPVIKQFLKRAKIEVGLMLTERFVEYSRKPEDFGVSSSSLPSQVRNVYVKLNISQSIGSRVDPMAEILTARYGASINTPWKSFFGEKYIYALQLLTQGDVVYDSGRSLWLSYQNSFNHALFLRIQEFFVINNEVGAVTFISRRTGLPVPFGVMLNISNSFSGKYPRIASALRNMNARRNELPGQHPYNFNTGSNNKHLRKNEQRALWGGLKTAFFDIEKIIIRSQISSIRTVPGAQGVG